MSSGRADVSLSPTLLLVGAKKTAEAANRLIVPYGFQGADGAVECILKGLSREGQELVVLRGGPVVWTAFIRCLGANSSSTKTVLQRRFVASRRRRSPRRRLHTIL